MESVWQKIFYKIKIENICVRDIDWLFSDKNINLI